jgi:FMN-dependent NADH-azoreductase
LFSYKEQFFENLAIFCFIGNLYSSAHHTPCFNYFGDAIMFLKKSADQFAAKKPLNVLRIDASGRHHDSNSRELSNKLIDRMDENYGAINLVRRDLAATDIPFVSENWINANFTVPEQRTPQQQAELALSDQLVEELKAADVLVIGVPIYNFGVPAVLKAWIDMIARARLTFQYSENGPVGLLKGKKAYLIVTSGGTASGSEIDFATGYMNHVLGFIGISDVEVIAADQLMLDGETKLAAAKQKIAALKPFDLPAQLAAA